MKVHGNCTSCSMAKAGSVKNMIPNWQYAVSFLHLEASMFQEHYQHIGDKVSELQRSCVQPESCREDHGKCGKVRTSVTHLGVVKRRTTHKSRRRVFPHIAASGFCF